jgi:hypothetical protein
MSSLIGFTTRQAATHHIIVSVGEATTVAPVIRYLILSRTPELRKGSKTAPSGLSSALTIA